MSDKTRELPPPPKAAIHRVTWDGSPGWQQYHDERDPLPTEWDDEAPDEVRGFYSDDQMRDYALAATSAQDAQIAMLREALECIAGTDPIYAALDPQRAVRVARAALAATGAQS